MSHPIWCRKFIEGSFYTFWIFLLQCKERGDVMKIYTKKGDKGTTSLVYGRRVSKSNPRVEAYGTIDEANSFIGLALSHLHVEKTVAISNLLIGTLEKVQTTLFHVGAELSTPSDREVKWKLQEINVKDLEDAIDTFQEGLKPLTQFILPGGSIPSSQLHVARTVIRRAERLCVDIDGVSLVVLAYLNRLSDLLFVLARAVNQALGVDEPVLQPEV